MKAASQDKKEPPPESHHRRDTVCGFEMQIRALTNWRTRRSPRLAQIARRPIDSRGFERLSADLPPLPRPPTRSVATVGLVIPRWRASPLPPAGVAHRARRFSTPATVVFQSAPL